MPEKDHKKPAFMGWPNSNFELYGLSFYSTRGSRDLLAYHKFNAAYAAQKFLLAVGDNFTWVNRTTIEFSDSGVQCTSPNLEEVIEAEPLVSWELPHPYDSYAARIRGKPVPLLDRLRERRASLEQRPKAERRKVIPRASRDGLISVQDLAKELNVEPGELRQILRKKQEKKPDAGWVWSQEEAVRIRKMMEEGLKR